MTMLLSLSLLGPNLLPLLLRAARCSPAYRKLPRPCMRTSRPQLHATMRVAPITLLLTFAEGAPVHPGGHLKRHTWDIFSVALGACALLATAMMLLLVATGGKRRADQGHEAATRQARPHRAAASETIRHTNWHLDQEQPPRLTRTATEVALSRPIAVAAHQDAPIAVATPLTSSEPSPGPTVFAHDVAVATPRANSLPVAVAVGVRQHPSGRFSATAPFKADKRYLGIYDTQDEAEAAVKLAIDTYRPDRPVGCDEQLAALSTSEHIDGERHLVTTATAFAARGYETMSVNGVTLFLSIKNSTGFRGIGDKKGARRGSRYVVKEIGAHHRDNRQQHSFDTVLEAATFYASLVKEQVCGRYSKSYTARSETAAECVYTPIDQGEPIEPGASSLPVGMDDSAPSASSDLLATLPLPDNGGDLLTTLPLPDDDGGNQLPSLVDLLTRDLCYDPADGNSQTPPPSLPPSPPSSPFGQESATPLARLSTPPRSRSATPAARPVSRWMAWAGPMLRSLMLLALFTPTAGAPLGSMSSDDPSFAPDVLFGVMSALIASYGGARVMQAAQQLIGDPAAASDSSGSATAATSRELPPSSHAPRELPPSSHAPPSASGKPTRLGHTAADRARASRLIARAWRARPRTVAAHANQITGSSEYERRLRMAKSITAGASPEYERRRRIADSITAGVASAQEGGIVPLPDVSALTAPTPEHEALSVATTSEGATISEGATTLEDAAAAGRYIATRLAFRWHQRAARDRVAGSTMSAPDESHVTLSSTPLFAPPAIEMPQGLPPPSPPCSPPELSSPPAPGTPSPHAFAPAQASHAAFAAELATALAAAKAVRSGATTLARKQTRRSASRAADARARAAAGRLLGAAPQRDWVLLCFVYKLRARAAASDTAQARRAAAKLAERIHELRSSPPRPLVTFDVGLVCGELLYRSELGTVTSTHPAFSPDPLIPIGHCLRHDGSTTVPLLPPADGTIRLCAESSGSICYYNEADGTAMWDAPKGSTVLRDSPLSSAACLLNLADGKSVAFEEPPPRLPPGLGFSALRGTGWMSIFEDAEHRILLFHVETGSVRSAPWICLRTAHGRVFFANLVTRQTRWLPPSRWMEDWVSRVVASHDGRGYGTPFDDTRFARDLLPPSIAHRRVEGGAPYLWEKGLPSYQPSEGDTELTYPKQRRIA